MTWLDTILIVLIIEWKEMHYKQIASKIIDFKLKIKKNEDVERIVLSTLSKGVKKKNYIIRCGRGKYRLNEILIDGKYNNPLFTMRNVEDYRIFELGIGSRIASNDSISQAIKSLQGQVCSVASSISDSNFIINCCSSKIDLDISSLIYPCSFVFHNIDFGNNIEQESEL